MLDHKRNACITFNFIYISILKHGKELVMVVVVGVLYLSGGHSVKEYRALETEAGCILQAKQIGPIGNKKCNFPVF